tara:strand:+ start:544 stop:1134 length:591 start_codon:yes stop_codon:yes gene_type:complete
MKFLFDLGGVFFDWDPKNFFKDKFDNQSEMNFFLDNICNNDWNLQQDNGRLIIDAENDLISKFPNYEEKIKMYYPNHRKMIKGIFHESIELLYELKKKNYSCYILSNWSSETFEGMTDEYNFLKDFDGMIISGDIKLVKPDKKIFELAIDKFNLTPNETIFIDDRIENINSAQNLNFKTVHLTDPKRIKAKINELI